MFRRLALAATALFLGVAGAGAQAITPLNSLYYSGGSPPTGYTAQPFQFFCTAAQAVCWPMVQIYDGTTRATVNAGDGGLTTHVANSSLAVTGTFWQATQPVSAASLPLPAGAATSALQTTINTTLGTPFQAGGSIGNTAFGISGNIPSPNVASAWGLLAQGGSTSGQLGSLALGSVTTAAPSYTTGQTSPLSLDLAGNLRVNVVAGGGSGGTSSSFGATFPATGTAAGAEYLASPPSLTAGQMVALQVTSGGSLHTTVDNTLAAGQAVMASSAPVVLASNQSAIPVQPQAVASGGASVTGNIAANNTTAVVVKASAGTLYSVQLAGLGSAPAYLKIYNAASATCGSGTPVARYMIPAASTAANGAGSNIDLGPTGVSYGTGITYCVTTGIADADTTAPAASTFLVNLVWK